LGAVSALAQSAAFARKGRVSGTSIQRDAMRRQPNALNLGECARDVAMKRRRYNRNPPHDPRMLDRLGVREVPVPHTLKQSA
jgi:hypothetical protein